MDRCMECGDKAKTLFEDPRNPPLDESGCLCKDCHLAAIEEAIEGHQDEIQRLEELKE